MVVIVAVMADHHDDHGHDKGHDEHGHDSHNNGPPKHDSHEKNGPSHGNQQKDNHHDSHDGHHHWYIWFNGSIGQDSLYVTLAEC